MATLVVAPAARVDVATILDGLERDVSERVALTYAEAFKAAFEHLADFPRTGAPRPKLGHDMRIWTVDPYVFYYRYTAVDDVVLIVRVLHGRRNVTRKFLAGP
jgi:toxin ParE1/3/4